MSDTVKVELHCHSSISDGTLSPEEVAASLALADVQYAALTDHDSLDGQMQFRQGTSRLGIGCISGIELTTYLDNIEIHLLGYGFSTGETDLQLILPALRPPLNAAAPKLAVERRLSSQEGIALLHNAGGIVFLAHPQIVEKDVDKLDRLVATLREFGIDGIEGYRPDIDAATSAMLCALARKHELLVSGGSDCHFLLTHGAQKPGIDIPLNAWKEFRNSLFRAASDFRAHKGAHNKDLHQERIPSPKHWQSFVVHVVLPAVLALALFAGVLLFAVLPAFEAALLDRKREMIRELTSAAWSVLAEAHEQERQGNISPDTARHQAKSRIAAMRYGRDGKDYFWIQDTLPRMVMHPWRPDLNGQDLSTFTDPAGEKIFVLFASLVKKQHEGYVHYVWQWKDDPDRLEPKESYIRLFDPWGWIIGTGLYVHDVKEELQRLTLRLALLMAAIFVALTVLLVYILRASVRIEEKKAIAEELLRETTNRYKMLVNSASEGMLIFSGRRCRYGNTTALELIGYTETELELLDYSDLFPVLPENGITLHYLLHWQKILPVGAFKGIVRRRDGIELASTISMRSIGTPLSGDFLLLIRRSVPENLEEKTTGSGVLGNLLKIPIVLSQDIRDEITRADTPGAIQELCSQAPRLVKTLLDNGVFAPDIARMLSSITDAATVRLLELGFDHFGKGPVPFAFIALGSQGRSEQTLFTDQDNAIIYQPSATSGDQDSAAYFNSLADFVSTGLVDAGYRKCSGMAMANNPRWCQPLETWKGYFTTWISRADAQELMDFVMFFDLRVVYGETALARDVRNHVMASVLASSRFMTQMAQNALQFKAPLRLFGKVVQPPAKGERSSNLDLKIAAMPIVNFARLYSLQQGIEETSTSSRLEELMRKGILLPSRLEEIQTAYALLFRLRLRHQASIMLSGGEGDNAIPLAGLGRMEEAILRECFHEIDRLQEQIRRDFLGG